MTPMRHAFLPALRHARLSAGDLSLPRTPRPDPVQHLPSAGWPLLAALAATVLLGACGTVSLPRLPTLAVPHPYSLNLQQGVVVDQKMIARLAPGMTRNQVGLTLGTPLLTDVLHADRWDYLYYTRKEGEVGEWRRFTCLFRDDRLQAVTGDVTLAATTGAAVAAPEGSAVPEASSGVPQPLPAGPAAAPAGPARP